MEKEYEVYSFYGENDVFRIFNGVIVIAPEEEIFDGGILEIKEDDLKISSYLVTFYIMSGNDKSVVMSNAIHDMTGGAVNMEGDLGKMSGKDFIVKKTYNGWDENLYCEMIITNLSGEQKEYQIPLELRKITASEGR